MAAHGVAAQDVQHLRRLGPFQHRAAPLPVVAGLRRQMLRRRDVELPVHHRIARRVLVDVGGAVADPLPGDKDRQFDVKLDLAHLERRGVAVAHEIADQAPILAHLLGAAPVGDARRLHHGAVVAHVVHHADEPMVEHRKRQVQDLLHRRDRGPAGLAGLGAQGLDVGLHGGVETAGVGLDRLGHGQGLGQEGGSGAP